MKRIYYALSLCCILSIACKESTLDKLDIQAFYFPIQDMKNGIVYEYHSISKDSLPPFYWLYQTIERDGNTYLQGTYYDNRFRIQQYCEEELVHNGTLMNAYTLYEYDSLGRPYELSVDIQSSSVFPFEVAKKGGIYLFSIEWKERLDAQMSNSLIRNKHYIGMSKYNFQDKDYDCVEFFVKEQISLDHQEEGLREYFPASKELYAKGIGLVYFKKQLNKELSLEYHLVNTYAASTFKKQYLSK